jgi:cytidine deaminase
VELDAEAFDHALECFPEAGRRVVAAIVQAEGFAGVVAYDQAMGLCTEAGLSMAGLMAALVPFARLHARPPISDYSVGAVAQGQSTGSLYFGANVELPGLALNASVHAEQAAVTNAWLHAEMGLNAVAVSAPPCGHCRQFLFETSTASTLAVLVGASGEPALLADLLPRAFGPADLGVHGGLLKPERHGLRLDGDGDDRVGLGRDGLAGLEAGGPAGLDGSGDPVVLAALDAAEASYAPYSGNMAGAALATVSGAVVVGRHAENAAFNPSLSPVQAAYAMWALRGDFTDRVVRAVLVERPTEVSQADAGAAALSSIAPGVALEVYRAIA